MPDWNVTHNAFGGHIMDAAPNIGGGMVSFDFGIIFGLVFLIAIIAILLYLASSLEGYRRFWNILKFVVSSLRFTAYGMVATGIAYTIYLIGSLIGESANVIDPIWYVYSIGALIGFTILGYGADLVVKRIVTHHKKVKKGIELQRMDE